MIHLLQGPTYDKRNEADSLEVCDVTYTNVRENWIHRERFLSSDEMIYLAKGELYLRVNGMDYILHRGCFFFLPRFSTISGYRRSDQPCEFYTVVYLGHNVMSPADMLREIGLTGSSIFTDELLKRLYDAKRNGEVAKNECDILFLALTTEIRRYLQSDAVSVPLMDRAIRTIDENLNTLMTVDELCDILGYNRDYISKQFLARYGITVKKYLDQKKLGLAKHLLLSSKMSTEQIARAIGFDDAQHFYKFFRYHEKISPTQFRKLNG